MAPRRRYLWLALAAVACPCHVPIVLAVLAGTGVAGVLSQHVGLVLAVTSVVFVAALVAGLRGLDGVHRPRPRGGRREEP